MELFIYLDLLLCDILLYECTMIYVFILLLMDFRFFLVWNYYE